ncbi:MAG: nucleotide sugar dehydrogenase [Holosporales bacterium]|jgi:UDPglucose 6-dehydrogenase|nr:nucleotide sugar dehydrogenase [Holosporales bacterium]
MLKITIIGGGYIGVLSGVCFCEFGFSVNIVESDPLILRDLKNNIVSVYEPSLSATLKNHQDNGRLRCAGDLNQTHENPDIFVIAIGPTTKEDQDESVHEVIRKISPLLSKTRYTVILIKTVTTVGACSIIKKNMQFLRRDLTLGEHYDVVINPDFLREGYAMHDFITPSRLVIGLDQDSRKAEDMIVKLYSTIISTGIPVIYTNHETAELIKYASMAFIVTKTALINEFVDLCEKSGANVGQLILGTGLDPDIGLNLLQVTPGFGGRSPPALMRGIIRTACILGLEFRIMQTVLESNTTRIKNISEKILKRFIDEFGLCNNKKLAILGLAHKPNTNDLCESPSMMLVQEMLKNKIFVSAYDPSLPPNSPNTSRIISKESLSDSRFHLAESPYEAAEQSDMIVVMTNWSNFLSIDFEKVAELMNKRSGDPPILMDMCNLYTETYPKNFRYIGNGQ